MRTLQTPFTSCTLFLLIFLSGCAAQTSAQKAVSGSDYSKLQKLKDVNEYSMHGSNALHTAVVKGDLEAIRILIENGADVNARQRTHNANSALHLTFAAPKNKLKIAELLLQNGADANIINLNGMTPVFLAVGAEREDILNLLIQHGADVNKPDPNGFRPLHIAAIANKEGIVQLLLDAKADMNALNEDGASALGLAALFGHENIVTILIERGADLNNTSESYPPLLLALDAGNIAIAQLLLDKGASVHVQAPDKTNALISATRINNTELAQEFLAAGIDAKAADNEGRTALYMAALHGNLELIQILLKAGADINAPTLEGRTALHVAALTNQKEIASFLIEKGAEVQPVNNYSYDLKATAKSYVLAAENSLNTNDTDTAAQNFQNASHYFDLAANSFQEAYEEYDQLSRKQKQTDFLKNVGIVLAMGIASMPNPQHKQNAQISSLQNASSSGTGLNGYYSQINAYNEKVGKGYTSTSNSNKTIFVDNSWQENLSASRDQYKSFIESCRNLSQQYAKKSECLNESQSLNACN